MLADTRRLVGASHQSLAALLAHLAEVEARGVHRTRACSSLDTYCIYELRFSEDAAFPRVSAARLLRRFPALLDAIASGELHLTALLMLGPERLTAAPRATWQRFVLTRVRELAPGERLGAPRRPFQPRRLFNLVLWGARCRVRGRRALHVRRLE